MKIPTTYDEAGALLRRAGMIENEIATCKFTLEEALQKLRKRHAELIKPLERDYRAIREALRS